jgi:hypothetical protein
LKRHDYRIDHRKNARGLYDCRQVFSLISRHALLVLTIRRIGEHCVSHSPPHQHLHLFAACAIAAHQTMLS